MTHRLRCCGRHNHRRTVYRHVPRSTSAHFLALSCGEFRYSAYIQRLKPTRRSMHSAIYIPTVHKRNHTRQTINQVRTFRPYTAYINQTKLPMRCVPRILWIHRILQQTKTLVGALRAYAPYTRHDTTKIAGAMRSAYTAYSQQLRLLSAAPRERQVWRYTIQKHRTRACTHVTCLFNTPSPSATTSGLTYIAVPSPPSVGDGSMTDAEEALKAQQHQQSSKPGFQPCGQYKAATVVQKRCCT